MRALYRCGFALLALPAACLASATAASADLKFARPSHYDDGGPERGMVVGNFNPEVDSDPDVAVSHGPNAISVLLGGTAGSFGPKADFFIGSTPWEMATGDFNGDQDPDLTVPRGAGMTGVAVVLGGPGGSFGAPTEYPTSGTDPNHVAVGDFDGDHDPDLVVGYANSTHVSVLLGGPGGSFGMPTDIAVGGHPGGIAVGDFNGDLDPDLAVAPAQGGDIAILIGGLGATFSHTADLAGASDSSPIAIGDFDGDSDSDLAAGGGSQGVAIFTGAGDGNFGSPAYTGGPADPARITIGNFDANSDPDLVSTGSGGSIHVLLGGAGASFTPAVSLEDHSAFYWGLRVADANADGDLDILAGAGGSLEVWLNAEHGPAAPQLDQVQPPSPANFNTPTLTGTAEAGSTVRIYRFGGCDGPVVATATAEEFADPGKTVTVADNSTTNFSASAVDALGVESACSSARTYTEDSFPPGTPAIGGTTPSPANDNSPEFRGSGQPDMATIRLYVDVECTGTPAAVGTLAEFEGDGITVSVPDDTTSQIYASAADQAGNVGACNNPVTYTEDSTGPATPQITATAPASPADDESPKVQGALGGGDPTTMSLYANATCAGSPASTGSPAAFTGDGIAVAVPPNAATQISARVADPIGNESACSDAITYVEDSGPPVAALSATPRPALTDDVVAFDAAGSAQPGGSITRYEWDLDGDGTFETDTGSDATTSRSYPAAAELHPAVRVTSNVGRVDTEAIDLAIRRRPPAGPVGVSINSGAQYTNDVDVSLVPVWPAFTRDLVVANDGGFAQSSVFPVDAAVPWTLESSGPERLPRTVYVRFDGSALTFTDDIILDETAPTVASAKLSTTSRKLRFVLRVRARDRVSGVARMQLARSKSRPAKPRRFRRSALLLGERAPRYVRVIDRAGNQSRWRRIAR